MNEAELVDKVVSMLASGLIPAEVMTIFKAVADPHPPEVGGYGYSVNGVVIGYSRGGDQICLDLDTGRILLLASWYPESPLVVNRDVDAFSKSMLTLLAMSPLYGETPDLDDADRAETRIRDAIEGIDATSTAEPDGFWASFLDDVGVGDYRGW
ncbi:SUKH-4 family immunity protein [Streptomyces sp. NPDC058412]|uniref:SUKH-4 family immunity protein n=1 Tax=Streptomyces sp. NPDC058412 TaxID=3346486 RepID=UPI003657C0E0